MFKQPHLEIDKKTETKMISVLKVPNSTWDLIDEDVRQVTPSS